MKKLAKTRNPAKWTRPPAHKPGGLFVGVYGGFSVVLVRKGDRYGMNNSITHNRQEPLVEFYDVRYKGPGNSTVGQFVSRYGLSTLDNREPGGLMLDGGVKDWSIDKRSLGEALKSVNLALVSLNTGKTPKYVESATNTARSHKLLPIPKNARLGLYGDKVRPKSSGKRGSVSRNQSAVDAKKFRMVAAKVAALPKDQQAQWKSSMVAIMRDPDGPLTTPGAVAEKAYAEIVSEPKARNTTDQSASYEKGKKHGFEDIDRDVYDLARVQNEHLRLGLRGQAYAAGYGAAGNDCPHRLLTPGARRRGGGVRMNPARPKVKRNLGRFTKASSKAWGD
jgi:hypothetical protein